MRHLELIVVLAALVSTVFTSGRARADNVDASHGATDQPEPLELKAWLMRTETSKDSNWHRFSLSIQGSALVMAKEYGGFKAPDNERRTRELTPETMDKVRELIRSSGLDRDVVETRPMEGIGIAQELRFEITSPAASRIHIAGRTHIWGRDAEAGESNLEHMELVRKAESLFALLWGFPAGMTIGD